LAISEEKELSDEDVSFSDTEEAESLHESKEEEGEQDKGEVSPSKPKKKSSWLFQRKKAIASKTATSVIGKALFKKFVDKETILLLGSVKTIITLEEGSKKAKQIKNNITKLAVKVLLLYDEKSLKEDSFDGLVFYFRRICSAVRNGWRTKVLEESVAKRVHDLIKEFGVGLEAVFF